MDMICSSLTKIFNGAGNQMAGSMCINPRSAQYPALAQAVRRLYETDDIPRLTAPELEILEGNSRSFVSRSNAINRNALLLSTWLQSHPAVKAIYYPGLNGQLLSSRSSLLLCLFDII